MTLAPECRQLQLFESKPVYRLTNNAQARNAYGRAAQEIVCRALSLQSIPTNGRYEICFDAKDADSYYEIKSVHQKSSVVLYEWRMAKESGSGVPLRYAILAHNAKGCRDADKLYDILNDGGMELFVLPASIIHSLAIHFRIQSYTPSKKYKRLGYDRGGYKAGYRLLPMRVIKDQPYLNSTVVFPLYGVEFKIEVYEHALTNCQAQEAESISLS